jgi:hypothetical protein
MPLTDELGTGVGCAASYWPLITAHTSATTSSPTTADPNRKILKNIGRVPST